VAKSPYIPTTTIYQDNKSAILLDNNYKPSSSRLTHNLNVRYFFVNDKIKKGKVKAVLCPTKYMLDYFFTKSIKIQSLYE